MVDNFKTVLIAVAYWIVFPVQTFLAGIVIRVLNLWGYDYSHGAALDILKMAVKIQVIQDSHSIQNLESRTPSDPFWIWFYNANKYMLGLNNHIIRWAISSYISPQEKAESKLAWLQ